MNKLNIFNIKTTAVFLKSFLDGKPCSNTSSCRSPKCSGNGLCVSIEEKKERKKVNWPHFQASPFKGGHSE